MGERVMAVCMSYSEEIAVAISFALLGMIAGFLLGWIAAWTGKTLVHYGRNKYGAKTSAES